MLEIIAMEYTLSPQVNLKHDKASGNYYLFCLETGERFNLNSTSYEILKLLQDGKKKDEIVKTLVENYDIDTKICSEHINELFNFMLARDLITT